MKAEYQQNLKDTSDLIRLANAFKSGLEKNGPAVFSVDLVKKLDDIEKVTKRIHNRMHH